MAESTPLTEETQQKMKEVKIVVPRMELLKCIFFGKRGKVVTLCWKGDRHSFGSMPLSTFECPTLNLDWRKCTEHWGLPMEATASTSCPIQCMCTCIRTPLPAALSSSPWPWHSSLLMWAWLSCRITARLTSYHLCFAVKTCAFVGPVSAAIQPITTITNRWPKIAWDWGEDVWATRLVQCMEMSGTSTDVRIIPAFRWTSRGYTSQINTLFPHVMSVKATPFHGMTDILLMGPESVGVVRVSTERLVVSIELGINKVAHHSRQGPQNVARESGRASC